MVAFGVPQSKCERHLFPPSSSWNKNILHTGIIAQATASPHGVRASLGLAFCCVWKNLSQGHVFLGDRFHIWGTKKRIQMGGPKQQRLETSRTRWQRNPGLGNSQHSGRGDVSEESGVNQPFYAHTHAGFTHSKNRPRLSMGPVLALCKNWIEGDSLFFGSRSPASSILASLS